MEKTAAAPEDALAHGDQADYTVYCRAMWQRPEMDVDKEPGVGMGLNRGRRISLM